ncbi:NAD(P)-dependent oxidoreductase [Fulvivirga sediminis]|uniref:Phosphoglycerate dehydrogenase n=1 Tax=Fulvivirga sediminis TaxID=2803949 RepID=A0A937F619_9BACT|nr:NAD(P)-dependent oxidoreductase [Fulvivirga sediminis]MBL3656405.1 phosphoglycerate dehydrogenase [Fulvivirga sediminis]
MNCLIADYMHDSLQQLLLDIGVQPDYRPTITREDILEIISDYEGLIIRSKTRIDEEVVSKASKLLFIARAGAGIDNLDEEAIEKRNIKIFNAPEGNRNALGEHTLGLLLSLMNNIARSDKEVREYTWDREGNRGYEVEGRTVALLGYGHMGGSFAKKVKGMGTRVIAYDKYKNDFSDDVVEEVSMEEVYKEADVFSIHVPLTSETKSLVDYNYISKFRKNFYLLNTSRGEVVSLDGVCKHIEEGKIIGAGLDVLENEKLKTLSEKQKKSFDYLVNSDKTLLTPHIAGWSFESYERINEVLVGKIRGFLSKRK